MAACLQATLDIRSRTKNNLFIVITEYVHKVNDYILSIEIGYKRSNIVLMYFVFLTTQVLFSRFTKRVFVFVVRIL